MAIPKSQIQKKCRRSSHWIKNTADDMCLARAIASSWALENKILNQELNRKYRSQQPTKSSLDLIMQHKKVHVSYYNHIGDATHNEGTEIARAFHNLADLPRTIPAVWVRSSCLRKLWTPECWSARMGNMFIYIRSVN